MTALMLLLICSTGLSLSCASAPPFPTKNIIEYDSVSKVCGLYEIINFETYQVKYVMDIECPSVFGFSDKEIPNIMNWFRDIKSYVKEHCK